MKAGDADIARMVKAFAERRNLMYELLSAIPGLSCVKPMGAFYMFPCIAKFKLDSLSFANRLLDQEGVALIPGQPFGADDHVRLSYACSTENIRNGLERLGRFCASL